MSGKSRTTRAHGEDGGRGAGVGGSRCPDDQDQLTGRERHGEMNLGRVVVVQEEGPGRVYINRLDDEATILLNPRVHLPIATLSSSR